MRIPTNNDPGADLGGIIELKAKGGRTLDTLFTLRPCFEGTPIAKYEPNDRNRVSAFARLYGYYSSKHPNSQSLYITIGPEEAPQNTKGFYLAVDETSNRINLMHTNPDTGSSEITAFWRFEDLERQLEAKHPSTLWIKANKRTRNGIVQFKYTEIEFTKSPQFITFISLVKSGQITYDWRGYTSISGAYSGKNHGNAWRIKPNAKMLLFGESEIVNL